MRFVILLLLLTSLWACDDGFEEESTTEFWTFSEQGGEAPIDPECPDPEDPEVFYFGDTSEECAEIGFGATGSAWCQPGQDKFIADCGCGCIGEPAEDCFIDGCPDGQYCHYEDNDCTELGGLSALGVCQPIPDSCSDEVDQVCGCDGRLHDGPVDCAAQWAGVDVHPDPSVCQSGPACIDETTGTVDPGSCFIFDECFAEGMTNPDDDCQFCDPSRSQLDWTEERGCAPQIDSGRFHSCAVDDVQHLHCWPEDDQPGGRASPPDGTYWQATTGHFHTCAIDTDDHLQCWGSDHEALTGAPEGAYWDVSSARWYSCAIDDDQQLQCWGRDILSHGQSNPPSGQFIAVSTASDFACAVRTTGDILCWGDSRDGLTAPPSGDTFVNVSTDQNHACALDVDGQIQCWGQNGSGQSNSPSGDFRQVTAGRTHSCAIDRQGAIECWGDDTSGQASPPEGQFRQVSAGTDFTCAFDMTNQIHCWGDQARIDAPSLN